jgi:hypothetical protein
MFAIAAKRQVFRFHIEHLDNVYGPRSTTYILAESFLVRIAAISFGIEHSDRILF